MYSVNKYYNNKLKYIVSENEIIYLKKYTNKKWIKKTNPFTKFVGIDFEETTKHSVSTPYTVFHATQLAIMMFSEQLMLDYRDLFLGSGD